jgi:hypothetical protein
LTDGVRDRIVVPMTSMRRSLVSVVGLALASSSTGCPGGDDSTADRAHGSETSAHHHTTEEGSGADTRTVDSGEDDPAAAYCACVFANCHEPYHAKWGEDEVASEAACLTEASALPQNGAEVEMGDFIECRVHFCELAASDATACAAALGDEVCI